MDSADVGIVLSLISPDGVYEGLEDLSLLFCFVDGLPCRDFVHCFRFRFWDGNVVLVWRCPRFKKVVHK